jgi:hypothetical protein
MSKFEQLRCKLPRNEIRCSSHGSSVAWLTTGRHQLGVLPAEMRTPRHPPPTSGCLTDVPRRTPHCSTAALASAALAIPASASATTVISSGVGEVNLGPSVIPNAATHWTVTWSYNGAAYVSDNLGAPSVQIQVENGPDPANADPIDPDIEPSGINGSGKITYCPNFCNDQGRQPSPWQILARSFSL